MSTVNIVMATYNGGKYIREQLDSILNSTYTDWSLAVFDDNSDDNTVDIIEEYVKKYPERILLHRNNVNRGSTINFLNGIKMLCSHGECGGALEDKGIRHSSNRAQYFMFADQDDVWLKDKIERTIGRVKQIEKKYGKAMPALVFTDAVVVDQDLQFKKSSFVAMSHLNVEKTDLTHLLMENKCMGCTMMMNRALAEKITEIPAGVRYHDWWVALIASAFGYISYLPEQSILYRQHGENQVGGESYAGYCTHRFASLRMQRNIIRATQRQASAFLDVYRGELNSVKLYQIQIFAEMSGKSWWTRRWQALKHGYLKTGLARNIGLMLCI